MLGFGIGGSLLALTPPPRIPALVTVSRFLLPLALMTAYLTLTRVRFEPYTLVRDRWALLRLLFVAGLLSLPFFLVSLIVGGTLVDLSAIGHRVYAVDLLGAAVGAIVACVALGHLPPDVLAMGTILLAALLLGVPWPGRLPVLAGGVASLAAALLVLWNPVSPNAYKDLSDALRLPGA